MSESADAAEAIVAVRVESARAVIAAGLGTRAGLEPSAPGADGAANGQLTLSPFWPLGYELGDELIVLELLTRPTASDSPPDAPPSGLTANDQLISGTAAFLFDKLVNPVLPLQRVAPAIGELPPINSVLDEVLHRARFAGSVRATSPAAVAARSLLFVEDDQGGRTETAVYREYLEFARRARDAQDAVDVAGADDLDQAVSERDGVLAEWLVRGHRRKIEDAIRVILDEELAAGFEDERAELIRKLEAGRRGRLDAPGFSYFPARLLPIRPLLDPDAAPSGWRAVEIGASEFQELLTDAAQEVPLPAEAVERAMEGFVKVTFEFLVCDVVRDWLSEEFFTARYWRLADGEVLSDGRGGGRLPGYAASLVFVRAAAIEFEGEVTAQFNPGPGSPPRLPVRMIRIVAAERAPRVLDPVRSLAAARDLELPLAVAMLTPAAPRPAQKPATVVVSQAARAALTTRLLRDHGFPFDTRAGIPVRDHRQFPPLELPERPARTVPVRVSITSSGTSLDGISVEVVSPDSVTHRPDLVGDQHSVSGSVEVPAAPAGKAAVVVVRVVDRDRPLDQQTLAVGAAPVDVRWSVAAEPIRIVLTAEKVPTLFGHVVEPVPRCPDPDEELSWE